MFADICTKNTPGNWNYPGTSYNCGTSRKDYVSAHPKGLHVHFNDVAFARTLGVHRGGAAVLVLQEKVAPAHLLYAR